MPLIVPAPLNEQRRIVTKVDELMRLYGGLEAQVTQKINSPVLKEHL
jgi:hypothetical protein